MRFKETLLLSNFGNGIEDPYIVKRSDTMSLQTGVFVLKPGVERPAFEALRVFLAKLPSNDERYEEVKGWVERLENFWGGKEEEEGE